MPYYIYKIGSSVTALVKNLDPVDKFESYKDAKKEVRNLRSAQGQDVEFKVVFAENQLAAEEMLSEQREKPILAEWEK